MFKKYLQHILFISMIIIYLYVIHYVYNFYKINNHSISSIIENKNCNQMVFKNMNIMGIITIIYEFIRYDIFSFITICFLLIGINGVIIYDLTNKIHFLYSFIVFISILFFMNNQCVKRNNIILYRSFNIQKILSIFILFLPNILYFQIFLLGNFAFFYMYLHFL